VVPDELNNMAYNHSKIANGDFCWHIHHQVLVEHTGVDYCSVGQSAKKRAEYIRKYKPEHEIETRLRLFRRVRAQKRIRELMSVYDRASTKRERDAAKKAIKELHDKECKNCPWNGKTIFPRKQKNKKT
jgi:hypothetical protein